MYVNAISDSKIPDYGSNSSVLSADFNLANDKFQGSSRIRSVDVFRGFAVFVMLFVANEGSFLHAILPLRLSHWNGLHLADNTAAFFLFIVGVSIPLAYPSPSTLKKDKARGGALRKIALRSLALFCLGIALNFVAYTSHYKKVTSFPLLGVLQRISICFFLISVMHLFLRRVSIQRCLALLYMLIYMWIMYIPSLSCGTGLEKLMRNCNVAEQVDTAVFHNFRMRPSDPYGLMATLMSLVTTYMGLELGRMISKQLPAVTFLGRSFTTSSLCLLAGILLETWIPFNRVLFSPSFALISAGIASTTLACLYFLLEVESWAHYKTEKMISMLCFPFISLGRNALLVFVCNFLVRVVLDNLITVHTETGTESLWSFAFEELFHSWISNTGLASFFFAGVHATLWTLVAVVLFKFDIIIKV